MKRCPECRRDYADDTLLYCLEDGVSLVQGSVPSREEQPATAILRDTSGHEAATRAQMYATDQTAVFSGGVEAEHSKSFGSLSAIEVPKAAIDKRILFFLPLVALVAVGAFFGYRYLSSGSGQINSIAVLPFQNVGGNPDSEYISDGLAESVIYRLSQIPDLKVSPRSSVFRYKGKEIDAENVGAELGVDAVMSGRVTQRGDNLTISVDLVDVRNQKTLWGEQYERKMSDLLATQREIASAVTQKLQIKLAGDDPAITKKYTSSNEAYQLYLKGRHAWNRRTAESLRQAEGHYNRAIAVDPGFALAYSGLAETYVVFSNYNVASAKDSMPQARAAATRALELDESLPAAHAAYGAYLGLFEYDFGRSEKEYRRAIELDPKYATAHQWLAELLSRTGRFDEGMAEIRIAQELDPLSPVISFNIGWQHFLARRYDEAIAAFDNTFSKFPEFPLSQAGRCWAYYAKGDLAKAVPECRRAHQLVPDGPNTGYLAMVLARSGNVDEARRLLDQLKKEAETGYVPATALAYAYIGLKQKEEALRMFELEVADHGYLSADYGVCPEYDEFRADPRFKALLKRMNLPEIKL